MATESLYLLTFFNSVKIEILRFLSKHEGQFSLEALSYVESHETTELYFAATEEKCEWFSVLLESHFGRKCEMTVSVRASDITTKMKKLGLNH
jgi:hypothetical protein